MVETVGEAGWNGGSRFILLAENRIAIMRVLHR